MSDISIKITKARVNGGMVPATGEIWSDDRMVEFSITGTHELSGFGKESSFVVEDDQGNTYRLDCDDVDSRQTHNTSVSQYTFFGPLNGPPEQI